MTRLLVLLCCLLLAVPASAASRPAPRPLTGSGLLFIPQSGRGEGGAASVVVYREPGLERLAELPPGRLPGLAGLFRPSGDMAVAVVTGRKGGWLKIIYDDADREGWLERERRWQVVSWPVFLKGRQAHLLPGLRKGFYQLRGGPSDDGAVTATLTRESDLRIIEVDGSWVMALVDLAASGWLRWRDDDGRLLLAIDDPVAPQKR